MRKKRARPKCSLTVMPSLLATAIFTSIPALLSNRQKKEAKIKAHRPISASSFSGQPSNNFLHNPQSDKKCQHINIISISKVLLKTQQKYVVINVVTSVFSPWDFLCIHPPGNFKG